MSWQAQEDPPTMSSDGTTKCPFAVTECDRLSIHYVGLWVIPEIASDSLYTRLDQWGQTVRALKQWTSSYSHLHPWEGVT